MSPGFRRSAIIAGDKIAGATTLLDFFDDAVEAAGQMQVGPMEFGAQHLSDFVLALLGAVHFANARDQPDRALAILLHLLFGRDGSVSRDDGIEIELQSGTKGI